MQIPGHIDDHDSVRPLRQQTSSENPGALVVKKILIPLPFDELRQQHRDGAIRIVPFDLQDVIDDRLLSLLKIRNSCDTEAPRTRVESRPASGCRLD
jgi:hypothetical protein